MLTDMNVINSNLCAFECGSAETILHCLRDCPLAESVWCWFVKDSLKSKYFSLNIVDWVYSNLHDDWGNDDLYSIPWISVFAYVSWNIWVNRCAVSHGSPSSDGMGIIRHCWANLKESLGCKISGHLPSTRKKEMLISWEHARHGVLKFNTDGSLWSNGNATGGGVLRDAAGVWVIGFAPT